MEANNEILSQDELFKKMQSGEILTPQEFESFFKHVSSTQFLMIIKENRETKIQERRIKIFMDGKTEGLNEDETIVNASDTILKWIFLEYSRIYLKLTEIRV